MDPPNNKIPFLCEALKLFLCHCIQLYSSAYFVWQQETHVVGFIVIYYVQFSSGPDWIWPKIHSGIVVNRGHRQ